MGDKALEFADVTRVEGMEKALDPRVLSVVKGGEDGMLQLVRAKVMRQEKTIEFSDESQENDEKEEG